MNWPARRGGWWRVGLASEISLDDHVLRIQSGRARRAIDLGTPGTKVSFHLWGMLRGTAVRVEAGGRTLVIACEGDAAIQADYDAPHDGRADFVMTGPHLEGLVAAFPKSFLGRREGTRSFWLWRNVFRTVAGILPAIVALAFVAAMGLTLRVPPMALGIGATLVLAFALVVLEIRLHRRTSRPAFRLMVDNGHLIQARADGRGAQVRWSLAAMKMRSIRWERPASGRAGPDMFDSPAIIIDGVLPGQLSIGSRGFWAKTEGPKGRPPQYLVSSLCWPVLLEALTARPPAHSPDDSVRQAGDNADPQFRHS